jgi:HPt (histidine-containing phosphotransfer) domain-containing protein
MSSDPSAPSAPRSAAAARLLPKFIAHRQRDVATIRDALGQDDFETISRLGHNMRGNGRSYGFPDIGEIGERMETAANVRNADAIRKEVAALEAWLDKVGDPAAADDTPAPRPGSVTRMRAAKDDPDFGVPRGRDKT